MSKAYQQPIQTLEPDTLNSLVVGVIISSLNARNYETTLSYGPRMRGVWTFTLKDSEQDTVNVTVWGRAEYVNSLSDKFHIGSVVDVINPKILPRKREDKNEMFTPSVSSLVLLNANEGSTVIQEHDALDRVHYEALLNLPMKPVTSARPLSNIMENFDNLQNQYVDIFVVVTFVSEMRNIITKDGRSLVYRDFECLDRSTQITVTLKLWEKEWVRQSGAWQPRHTVLFISDALVALDKYKNRMAITIVKKTLITENPCVPQAADVRKALKTDSEYMPLNPFLLPIAENIHKVMSIQEITQRLNKKKIPTGAERDLFLTIVYAKVTDIDMNPKNGALITRCAMCKRIVLAGNESCMNLDCPSGNGKLRPMNTHSLFLKVNLKDETGWLIGCRLTGEAAERALGITVEEFKSKTMEERKDLKWKLVLELCEVRLQILGPTDTFPTPFYNILSLSVQRDIDEISQNFDENNTTSSEK